MLTRTQLQELIKGSKPVVIRRLDGSYRDCHRHLLEQLDEHPYEVQETPGEFIVGERRKRFDAVKVAL